MRQYTKSQWQTAYREYRSCKKTTLSDMTNVWEYLLCHKVFKNNPANHYIPVSDLRIRLAMNDIFNVKGLKFH